MNKNLTDIFYETQQFLWDDFQLSKTTRETQLRTRVFPENYQMTRLMNMLPTYICVSEESILDIAKKYANSGNRVAILNTANAVNPGGGVVYGAVGLEENLCRCTNIYPCLTKPEIYREFYGYHSQMDLYCSDRVIYTENVTAFRSSEPPHLFLENYYSFDVISCSAPNASGMEKIDEKKLRKIISNRVKNIFAVAEAFGVQILILGAFGCEVLGNPPELVAEIFEEQINRGDYKNSFREIIFSIPSDLSNGNYIREIFKSVLCPWQQNVLYEKNISILGDDISTFWGSVPQDYYVFYDGDRALKADIHSVDDMWWMKTIKYFGGRLLVNNSSAGTMASGSDKMSGHSDQRIYSLYNDQGVPDVIFVFMGLVDLWNNVPVTSPNTVNFQRENYELYFKPSYEMMIWKLKQAYPWAEIYCATLPKSNVENPYQNECLQAYNRVIRQCAVQYNCRLIDMNKIKSGYETVDSYHPNGVGMQRIADIWISEIENTDYNVATALVRNKKTKMRNISIVSMFIIGSCLIVIALILIVILVLMFI